MKTPPLILRPAGGRDRWHMAHRAADSGEELLAGERIGADWPSRWCLRGAHEVGERHDVHPVGLGSGTGWKREPNPMKTSLEVFSSGKSGLVKPISLR